MLRKILKTLFILVNLIRYGLLIYSVPMVNLSFLGVDLKENTIIIIQVAE